ncbi:hypothetical protein KJH81_001495 [Escherichia coli]|nr:hypothetical protein [Escherichia coli]EJS5572547.1 hypothetical protein [Escherichia coli]
MIEEKEVDKEMPDTADDFVTFDGGLYEFDTSAGWIDKWPQPTRQELIARKSFGEDAERLANNKWLNKFIAEGDK